MAAARCGTGYPAHGVVIADLPGKLAQYIRHRRTREKLVTTALGRAKAEGRSLTTREIATRFYGVVPEDVFESALEPFTAQVLGKLAEDGSVGFSMGGGTRMWFLRAPKRVETGTKMRERMQTRVVEVGGEEQL